MNQIGIKPFLFLLILSLILVESCHTDTNDLDPKTKNINLPEGFHIEHLYSPQSHDQGSWIAMTFDDKGRMITSDQYGDLYRITIPNPGYNKKKDSVQVEKLPLKIANDTLHVKYEIGFAHGLLYAFNSLYVMVNAPEGDESRPSGLYRLQDTDGDDVYDKLTLIRRLNGEGEHGPHVPVLSPDGKSIYIVAGNFTELPEMDVYRLPSSWRNDNLLPILPDPNGFGVDKRPPGGWIAKTDPEGKNWELVAAGFRNPFGLAFNEYGDLFTYDSDMEWDLGLPWYRPTRICYVMSGSDFGYRENNLKWSPEYIDNIPAVLNVGQGSPTTVLSGLKANFPDKYRRGVFAFDWSFGIIYHVDLIPDGASYKADAAEFLTGTPLPLTAGTVGPDGALYFATGGRRLESDVYRIYYKKNSKVGELKESKLTKATEDAVNIRRELEKMQLNNDLNVIEKSWSYLNNKDRFIRYAARIALENQSVELWKDKLLHEKDPETIIQSILALARTDKNIDFSNLISTLLTIQFDKLQPWQKTDFLRTMEVVLSRGRNLTITDKEEIVSHLTTHFPLDKDVDNRLLSKILVFCGDSTMPQRLVPLLNKVSSHHQNDNITQSADLILRNYDYGRDIAKMLANLPPAQQIYYAIVLCEAEQGWNKSLRDDYFKWFYKAFDQYEGGHSYIGYIDEARQKALGNVSKSEYAYYNQLSGDSLLTQDRNSLANKPKAVGPGRHWTVDEGVKVIGEELHGRNFENGKKMFAAATCSSCHRVGNVGSGEIGPDLTQLGTRFTYKDMLEAIINPSETISSQYASSILYLKDGKTIVGRIVKEDKQKYYLSQNPYAPLDLNEIEKSKVTRKGVSDISIMPPGLIYSLNEDELKDLLAFLKSGGDENNEVFK